MVRWNLVALVGAVSLSAIACGDDDEPSEQPNNNDSGATEVLPGVASGPAPAVDATGVELSPTLSWTAGANATSYNVYLANSLSALNAATRSSSEFVGNVSAPGSAVGPLAAGQIYFWRVDSVGGTPETTVPGTVWAFMTAEAETRGRRPTPCR